MRLLTLFVLLRSAIKVCTGFKRSLLCVEGLLRVCLRQDWYKDNELSINRGFFYVETGIAILVSSTPPSFDWPVVDTCSDSPLWWLLGPVIFMWRYRRYDPSDAHQV